LAALAALDAFLKSMISAPRLATLLMKKSVTHLLSFTAFGKETPSTVPWLMSGY